ncbi:RES family NAD+ phosphorylase [Oceanithermus sp.]
MASIRLVLWRAYDPNLDFTQKSSFNPLAGEGASFGSGRWHTKAPGKRIVYASEHPALAYLEMIARAEGVLERLAFVRFEVVAPEVHRPPEKVLRQITNRRVTRSFGDGWYANHPAPVLEVPSVILPFGRNYLIRAVDPNARINLLERFELPVDERIRKALER